MSEKEWVELIIGEIGKKLRKTDAHIEAVVGRHIAYANEVLSYGKDNKPKEIKSVEYETDILIYEKFENETWKPRVVVEAKLGKITTHDAITYSQKASAHKYVHPYLRYGIIIGNRKHYPLPGRLFRHGQHFDFMASWKAIDATSKEFRELIEVLNLEIEASRKLEEMMFNSRMKDRGHYSLLHKPLVLKSLSISKSK